MGISKWILISLIILIIATLVLGYEIHLYRQDQTIMLQVLAEQMNITIPEWRP